MNGTSHERVLASLSHRADRFRNLCKNNQGDPHSWALDETGTIRTLMIKYSEAEQQEKNEVNNIDVLDEVLQVHGYAPPSKAEGTIQLIYENINGLCNRISNNEKLENTRALHDELEVDIAGYCKHQLNMTHKAKCNGFNQLFKGGKAAIQSIVAHNVHKNFGKTQQGGTSMIMFGPITEQIDFKRSRKDNTGLGRWTVMTLQGEGIRTQVVCGYNPCGNSKLNSGTSYQQHRRFFVTQQKDLSCPRRRFREDLIKQLEEWREEGDRIIICMDANENIYKKSIRKALTNKEGLNMVEVVGEFTGKKIGATFFWGSKPIDGIWATKDIGVMQACVMPAGFGVGDHRMLVVNFQADTVIGKAPFKVKPFTSCQLNTKVSSGATQKYLQKFEENLSRHRMIKKLGVIHLRYKSKKRFQREINKLDKQSKDMMTNAEKKCRRIKSGRIPFSPELSLWIRCTQVYRLLIRYHLGFFCNVGNLKRAARRCGISKCLFLSLEEIWLCLDVCIDKCDYFCKHGQYYRRKHLYKRLQEAKDKENERKEKEILAIIEREKNNSLWKRLNYSMGKHRGGAPR